MNSIEYLSCMVRDKLPLIISRESIYLGDVDHLWIMNFVDICHDKKRMKNMKIGMRYYVIVTFFDYGVYLSITICIGTFLQYLPIGFRNLSF